MFFYPFVEKIFPGKTEEGSGKLSVPASWKEEPAQAGGWQKQGVKSEKRTRNLIICPHESIDTGRCSFGRKHPFS